MRLLDDRHVRELGANWPELVAVIRRTAGLLGTGEIAQPLKPYLRFRDEANRIIAMPAFVGGETDSCGVKWIASFPGNLERGLPRAHSLLALNDPATGEPVALFRGALISAIRTAAVSAAMTEAYWRRRSAASADGSRGGGSAEAGNDGAGSEGIWCEGVGSDTGGDGGRGGDGHSGDGRGSDGRKREDTDAARADGREQVRDRARDEDGGGLTASVPRFAVGIVGFGPIGRMHLEMLDTLYGERLEKVRLHDVRGIDPGSLEGRVRGRTEIVADWREAYDVSDVFLTCTASSERYVDRPPRPGSLLLNVSLRDYRPESVRNLSAAVVDDWTEVCRENTDIECLQLQCGWNESRAIPLKDALLANGLARLGADEPVFFNPMGMAAFDMAIAAHYYRKARAAGIGTEW